MKKIIALLLCALFLGVCLGGCKSETNGGSDSAAGDKASTEQGTDDMVIETSYLTLHFPAKWEDKVKTKEDKDKVTFSCGDDKLFDVFFNSKDGNKIATYDTEDGEITVSVKSYEIPEKAKNRDELLNMQEDINYLLSALEKEYAASDKKEEPTEAEVYKVEVSLLPLYYPVRWKDKATFTEKDGTITLTEGKTKIFTLTLGGKDGDLLGTYDGKELRLSLSEVKKAEHIAMQEDINTVIRYLNKEEKFKSANE